MLSPNSVPGLRLGMPILRLPSKQLFPVSLVPHCSRSYPSNSCFEDGDRPFLMRSQQCLYTRSFCSSVCSTARCQVGSWLSLDFVWSLVSLNLFGPPSHWSPTCQGQLLLTGMSKVGQCVTEIGMI